MNKHEITLHARCPYAPVWDYYTLTLTTREFVEVHALQKMCDEVRGKEMTQESIADLLRERLPHHIAIELVGHHGQNCRSVVTR
jgi:ribonuclease I